MNRRTRMFWLCLEMFVNLALAIAFVASFVSPTWYPCVFYPLIFTLLIFSIYARYRAS